MHAALSNHARALSYHTMCRTAYPRQRPPVQSLKEIQRQQRAEEDKAQAAHRREREREREREAEAARAAEQSVWARPATAAVSTAMSFIQDVGFLPDYCLVSSFFPSFFLSFLTGEGGQKGVPYVSNQGRQGMFVFITVLCLTARTASGLPQAPQRRSR